jgi:hypothetical protein
VFSVCPITQFVYFLNVAYFKLARGNMHYFDRVRGLFRICFPYDEKPRRNWMELVQVSGNEPDPAIIKFNFSNIYINKN